MNSIAVQPKLVVSADGVGIVAQARGLLLAETARVPGRWGYMTQARSRWM